MSGNELWIWGLIIALALAAILWLLRGHRAEPVDTAEPAETPPAAPPSALAAGAAAPEETPAPVVRTPAAVTPILPTGAEAPAGAGLDDIALLKGVGPKLKALLAENGVTSLAQIAGWSAADIAAIDARLGTFKGRIGRDQWVEQARLLSSGDIAGFEAKFGKL